ncbi:hypothetical protein ACEN2J_07255 [Pseudorhodobacter sp. W20_MBD10_FR17]|uniref:hypothetical protein n=1 Tax=Pseudorhodobacter sp. W20_MBD10_FR17 TaxID=3240266 RepID=UPI003F9465D6
MDVGDFAVAYLVGIDGPSAIGSESSLKVEHFAFIARNLPEFVASLHKLDVPYRRIDLASTGIV